jgi:hypothetical protein
MKLIVVGNSHVGAIRQGWDLIEDLHPQVSVEFFAMHKAGNAYCRLSDRVYGLDTSRADSVLQKQCLKINGALEVNLAGADAVLIAGWEIPFPAFQKLIQHSIDGPSARMSSAFIDAILTDTLAGHIPEMAWQNWQSPKVFLALKPRVSESVQQGDNLKKYPFWGEWLIRLDAYAPFYRNVEAAFGTMLKEVGIEFIPQPTATLTEAGLTKEKFRVGSTGVDGAIRRPVDDVAHANGEYGSLILQHALNRMGALTVADH